MLVDTHCHIFNEYYDNIDELIKKINDCGIKKVINNAIDYKSSLEVLKLCNLYDGMYCVLGLHPESNLDELNKVLGLIKNNVSNKKMIGIGEIGLDYYYDKSNKETQIKVLDSQLSLAEELNLPVIIHSRESTNDMLTILKKYNVRGIIHCFNGSIEVAKEYIKMGYKLGINGVVTFKNCKLISVIKNIGINDLVFETDSPYLTPEPNRGKRNDSSYINDIVKFISENIGISVDKLVDISNKNIREIFDI